MGKKDSLHGFEKIHLQGYDLSEELRYEWVGYVEWCEATPFCWTWICLTQAGYSPGLGKSLPLSSWALILTFSWCCSLGLSLSAPLFFSVIFLSQFQVSNKQTSARDGNSGKREGAQLLGFQQEPGSFCFGWLAAPRPSSGAISCWRGKLAGLSPSWTIFPLSLPAPVAVWTFLSKWHFVFIRLNLFQGLPHHF